jgi:signal transduction histidine kinase
MRWILLFVFTVVFFEGAFSAIERVERQNTWKSVASILRNEANSANSYQVSRALSDMEREGWIKCVKLSEDLTDLRVFYDTTSQAYCGTFAVKTDGILQGISGARWRLSFAAPENIWFNLVRFSLPLLLLAAFMYLHAILLKQKKRQIVEKLKMQIENDFLLDLARQTKHDIASPIGALKILSQHLDVVPEHLELLKNITSRIDGIFTQLKTASDNPFFESCVEMRDVDIAKTVSNIVAEKLKEHGLESSSICLKVPSELVVANRVELERILSNIMNNSIEAKKIGEPLAINVETMSSERFCVISIADNGIGIDEDVLSRIGEKGFSYGKNKDRNSGIGIHNAKKILLSFGGEFALESKKGIGTTVKLSLRKSASLYNDDYQARSRTAF